MINNLQYSEQAIKNMCRDKIEKIKTKTRVTQVHKIHNLWNVVFSYYPDKITLTLNFDTPKEKTIIF